jgi:hypothetical protein
MLLGSPPRAAHRATPEAPGIKDRRPSRKGPAADGGFAFVVQGLGPEPAGQHRHPAAREPERAMQMVMSALGAAILLAIAGLSGFFIIAEVRRGHADTTGRTLPADPSEILTTRGGDAIPLTLDEVFPESEIRTVQGAAPYRVDLRHIDTDCDIAATGELGRILDDQQCSQVVRATMTAPYGNYRVTTGLFNMADAIGAEQVGNTAKRVVEGGTGTFAAMSAAGPGTDPTHQPLAQVNWHEHGHFLLYAVITRPDGQVVHDDDPYARQITVDLLESYLNGQVLAKRAARDVGP